MTALTIGDVSRATGVPASAIRFYESQGLLRAAGRAGGRRQFDAGSVDALRVIRLARDLGFSVGDVALLLNGFSSDKPPNVRWRELARRKLAEVNATLERAASMKRLLEKGLRCDCVSVHDCLVYECDPPVTMSGRRT